MDESPSYLKNVALAAGIFAVVITLTTIYSGYSLINSEFDGSGLPPGTFTSLFICLLALLVGLIAVKLQSVSQIEMTLGRGAMIGLVAGILTAVFSSLISHVWYLMNPDFPYEMVEAMIENYERIPGFSAKMAEETGADALEGMTTIPGMLKGMGINAAIYGVLNALSGMLGAKLFCDDPAEL